MLYLIYNNVIGYDSKFNLVPELATKWDVSSDGKQITLHLKDGMKFHDGTDCDAAAVKWSLERVLDPQVNSPQAGSLAAIDTIDAPDNTTVVLNLKDAGRPVLSNLGQRPGFVVPKSAVDKEGQDFGQKPVGSGPFKFVEWVPDSHITVERFDGYWDTSKPYLDKITMTHVPEGQVQATQLRTGEADIIDAVSAPLVQVLKGAQNVVIEENESGRFIAVTWDVSKPPFDNKDLRVALAYGTDREEVKKVIYSGTGRVATHPIGIGWAYDASLDNTYYTYDADKAKEYIDKAGVAGQSFTITVGNTQSNLAFVQLLQSQYEKLGIKIEIKTVNAADAYAMVKAGQIDWTNKSWSPRSDPDTWLRELYYSTGFQNTTNYKNPDLDKLLDEAAQIYDTSKAAPMYHQAEKMIVDDAPDIYMHWPAYFVGRRDAVQNFVYNPDLVLRLRDLWLSQ